MSNPKDSFIEQAIKFFNQENEEHLLELPKSDDALPMINREDYGVYQLISDSIEQLSKGLSRLIAEKVTDDYTTLSYADVLGHEEEFSYYLHNSVPVLLLAGPYALQIENEEMLAMLPDDFPPVKVGAVLFKYDVQLLNDIYEPDGSKGVLH